MSEEKFNKVFNTFIFVGMAVCVIISCIGKLQGASDGKLLLILSSFGALMGVVSTILSANGSVWNFLFGLIDVIFYSYILYDSNMPSQFLLHVLYFLPMEFVGFFQWRKRGASSRQKVKPQRIHGRKWIVFTLIFLGVFAATFSVSHFALSRAGEGLNYPKMALDALVTTANIVALIMMAFAYAEQWYLWTLVNISSIVIWSVTMSSDATSAYAIIPVVKYSFYFINGLNGIRIWMKMSKVA